VIPSRIVALAIAFVLSLVAACVVAELLTSRPSAKSAGVAARPGKQDEDAGIKHPGLRTGTTAPDFRLPDRDGHYHSLAEFKGRRTLLAFFCGCSRCRLMASAIEEIERNAQDEKPQHLTVMSILPQNLQSWKESTGYPGTFLFENGEDKPVIHRYDGAPCPRVYVLDPELHIEYVSSSPDSNAQPGEVLAPLARALHSVWIPPATDPGARS
jgi:peroxiredoxin